MNDYGFGSLVVLAIAGLVAIPLALWKLVELGIWFFSHVSWTP